MPGQLEVLVSVAVRDLQLFLDTARGRFPHAWDAGGTSLNRTSIEGDMIITFACHGGDSLPKPCSFEMTMPQRRVSEKGRKPGCEGGRCAHCDAIAKMSGISRPVVRPNAPRLSPGGWAGVPSRAGPPTMGPARDSCRLPVLVLGGRQAVARAGLGLVKVGPASAVSIRA